MRLDIRHVTRFDYDAPVWESQNEVRACPVADDRQQLLYYDVVTTPAARVASYVDYWGTRVDSFGIREPHATLEVVASSHVETRAVEASSSRPVRSSLDDPVFRDAHYTFLQPSPHVSITSTVHDVARDAAAAATDVAAVIEAIQRRVGQLRYRPGSTTVGVSVDAVLASGSGVCQDFAHVAIAMYRAVGIPARYVSGYFFTGDDATGEDVTGDEVDVETHAWIEVAVPDAGWVALDPTNDQLVGERYVTIGRGRDYDDVAPLRGVFSGPPEHSLEVRVTMRRFSHDSSNRLFRDRARLDVHPTSSARSGISAAN